MQGLKMSPAWRPPASKNTLPSFYQCQYSIQAAKTLIDYMEDGKKGKEPELDLSLDFDVDMNKINQKIDALILDE